MKKFTVLGTSEFTKSCIDAILDSGEEVSQIVSLPKDFSPMNSINLEKIAQGYQISFLETKNINSPDTVELIKSKSPDYILSCWPRILKKEIIYLPKEFTIGTHPTYLPHNRGRHPLHWMIHLGINKSALSFFKIDDGVDTGDVLLQVPFEISPKDFIRDANSKLCQAGYEGTKLLCQKLKQEDYFVAKQDHSKANYWRKRTPYDSLIDTRMPADLISRLVRSYASPFPFATLLFEDYAIPISNVKIANTGLGKEEIERIEPGKILEVQEKRLKIKVDDAIIELESPSNFPERVYKANYLHPPMKYLSDSCKKTIKIFGDIERTT